MTFAKIPGNEKARVNMQDASDHHLESYFIILDIVEEKFDDRFLSSIALGP